MTQAGFVPYSLSAPSVDTTPPTAPTNVVVSNAAANQTATVSFTGSTDNKAVIGYYAYLDGENVPWVGSQVGNSPIELTGVPAGNHTVVVKAFDAAGNLSANSSSVAFSIPNILGVNPIFTGVYPNLSAFNAQYVAGNIGLGNYLIAGSGSGVSITVNAAGLSGGGVYPSVSALNTDAASGFLPNGLYVGGDSLYIWDGVSLINDSSGYQFVELSGNLSLAAPFAKPTVLVNSSANNYTVTLAASGIGNFSIWRLGSGTISVQSAPENLFPYANDFTQASAWTLNNGTITANQSVADPWGGTTASTLTASSTGSMYMTGINYPTTNENPCVAGIWVQGVGTSIGAKVALQNNNNGSAFLAHDGIVTLSSAWQFIKCRFNATQSAGNQWVLLATNNSWDDSTFPNSGSINIAGAQLVNGTTLNKPFFKTTGPATVLTSPTNILGVNPILITDIVARLDIQESTPGSFLVSQNKSGFERPCYTGTDTGFLIVRSGSTRGDAILLAASDSARPQDADYICTGSNDDVIITDALNALRGVGGKVKLRAGSFITANPIVHGSDWVSLEGESRPMWSRYHGNYFPANGGGAGAEGFPGGSKIRNVGSSDCITVDTLNFAPGEARHRGLAFRNLYIFGNGSGRGIADTNATDTSEISGCLISNCGTAAIDIGWDTGTIFNNNLQCNPGAGLKLDGCYAAMVTNNIVWDNNGSGIIVTATTSRGNSIIGNRVGSFGASGILVNGPENLVIGNEVMGAFSTANLIEITGSAAQYNSIVSNKVTGLSFAGHNNTAAIGCYIHGGATNNTVNGNLFNNSISGATGYAIQLGASGDTSAVNNNVAGNQIYGGWNSGSSTTIKDFTSSATNYIRDNQGHQNISTTSFSTLAITSGTAYTNTSTGDQQIFVNGTITALSITRNGTAKAVNVLSNFTLKPADAFTATFTGSPVFYADQMF